MSAMQLVDCLAAFEPVDAPFISLYVSTLPDGTGREHFEAPIRKELRARARTYRAHTPARASFDRDTDRILTYLRQEREPLVQGVAIFTCAAADDFFQALPLA